MITYLLAWGKKTLGSTDLMHAWFSRTCAVEPSYDVLMRRLSFMETHVQRRVGYNEMFEQCRSRGHADCIYTRCCPYINGLAINLLVYTLLHLVLARPNSPNPLFSPYTAQISSRRPPCSVCRCCDIGYKQVDKSHRLQRHVSHAISPRYQIPFVIVVSALAGCGTNQPHTL